MRSARDPETGREKLPIDWDVRKSFPGKPLCADCGIIMRVHED